ncbi:hypothetical protein F4821DRAFT_222879 [Hypoxylon rubiginosum]|uniref:Uncharacterized protein n=1 Tax=Hypoxylon rubiginosum TaxID=110542 RepID=A0ACC0DLX6_9PEZI|nr:hypothetical protein F4821DRAFT_222879 [Hypoxylon rubiginosum]
MSFNRHYDQPGLEVAPEPELPQVVEGPTIIEKLPDGANQYGYEQQHQYQQGAYYQNNGAYPPSGYPPSTSHEGTYVTDGVPPSSAPPSGGTILGLQKKTFWFIFGPLIALLVIGLALGLGLGLGLSHDSSNSDSSATPATTPTTTSSSPTSSATAASTAIACPQANGTTYEAAGNDPFLVLCNVDYNGNGGGATTDIGNEETSTVEDCIDVCAGNSSCAGAGWGNYNGHNICWMKGSLGTSQDAPNWFFVIRQ